MLIKCPECELQVSDKALSCPHCGYPMKSGKAQPRLAKSSKHKRLPNGFGQISYLKNRNLRNPWRAMVCVGKNAKGRPVSKLLKPQAYFATYNDAYAALVEYNKNPYDLEDDIRLSELYDKWTDEYFASLKNESTRTIKSAWARCENIKTMRVKDVRARHIKAVMDAESSANMKSRIKSMFNLMLDYALEHEVVNINYARTFKVGDDILKEAAEPKRNHISFTDDEMNTLWSNIFVPYVDLVLIQCYTGLRPQEIGLIEKENINFENWTLTGGMKTEAGTNRVIPIHPRIRDFVKKYYDESEVQFVFTCEGKKMTYDKYANRFEKIVTELNINPLHRPHDPRKTFVTMAKKAGVDEYAIKRIVGHAISDLTEKVYTDRDVNWLREEIEKI